jgi:hypothetical protein
LACRNRHFSIILACSGPMEITTSDLRCLYALVDEAPYWRHRVKGRLTGGCAPRAGLPAATRHDCGSGLPAHPAGHASLDSDRWPAGRPDRGRSVRSAPRWPRSRCSTVGQRSARLRPTSTGIAQPRGRLFPDGGMDCPNSDSRHLENCRVPSVSTMRCTHPA